jgi:hypothetical protein
VGTVNRPLRSPDVIELGRDYGPINRR